MHAVQYKEEHALATELYSPASHAVHAESAGAPVLVLYKPGVQEVQRVAASNEE